MTDASAPSDANHPHLRRVLQGLRLHREPGWHFPGHYLGLSVDRLAPEGVAVSMPVDPLYLDRQGRVVLAAVAVLCDVALAIAVRGRVGAEVRLATVSMRLSFSGAPARDRLHAHCEQRFGNEDLAMPMAVSSLALHSGDALFCVGEASFAVLDNRRGTPPHPLPPAQPFEAVVPLPLNELSEAEAQVVQRARQAIADSQREAAPSFLECFWDLRPQITAGVAECEFDCAMHVSNRVGDVQGGVLLGLAAHTCAALAGPGWQLQDISALFLAAGSGSRLRARAQALRMGRNIASVSCTVTDEAGTALLQAQATLSRERVRD